MTEAPVSFKDVKFKMFIPNPSEHYKYPGGNVQSSIYKEQVWAKEESLILSKILDVNHRGLVVDIGSNTGYFSFIALSKNYKVIAVEANTIHKPYFMETMRLNNFSQNDVRYVESFVGSSKEDTPFDGWSGYEAIVGNNRTTLVKTVALDDLCEGCLFLKIDVEGAEPDVFKSGINLIQNSKIPYIMFELTYIINDILCKEQVDILGLLHRNNYTLYEIEGCSLVKINNFENKIKKWESDYFNHHKKFNPSVSLAGTNMLAIHKNSFNPFTKMSMFGLEQRYIID